MKRGPRKRIWKRERNKGAYSVLITTFFLALFGVVMVYSASSYVGKTQYGDSFFFAKKQLIGVGLGTVAMWGTSRFDYEKLKNKKWQYVLYIIAVVLLSLVFVPGLGITNYGATRWIGVGGITLQPSEFAKYAFVIFSAGSLSRNMGKARTLKGCLPVLFSGGIICVLIMLEPNMSVTMCVGVVMLGMLFLTGMKMKYFLWIGLPALLSIPVLIVMEPYRLLRLSAFLDPWASPKNEGYQLIQSLYALGNGGWFGVGLFRSRQKYRFLPFAESDFILSIIGEEFGFIGLVAFFCCCFYLVIKGIRITAQTEDFFSFLLAGGITLVYGVQMSVNALVVSGAIPPTGLPLPLISSGNTSIIITMSAMGLLYRISKQSANTKEGKNTYNKA